MMAAIVLPELRGCPRTCASELLAREKLPHSTAVISDGRWAILRLKEVHSEAKVVDLLYTDPDLAWVFPLVPRDLRMPRGRGGTAQPLVMFTMKGIVTCGKRTILGLPWSPGEVRGRPPMFNLDQLTAIHAMILKEAVGQGNSLPRR